MELTQWNEYIGVELAATEIDERYAGIVVEKLKAISNIKHKGEKTATAAKAMVFEDPEFEEAQDRLDEAYAKRKLIAMLYNNAEKAANLVSRELTRRTGRSDRENRGNRWKP